MPAYNFQKQFVPMILNGSKAHTIRRKRKRPTVPGDELSLYTGMRTKNCILITVAPCMKVEPIKFYLDRSEIYIWIPEELDEEIGSYRLMSAEEVNALAHADGFDDVYNFFVFFKRYKSNYLDNFEIIHWDPKSLINFWEMHHE